MPQSQEKTLEIIIDSDHTGPIRRAISSKVVAKPIVTSITYHWIHAVMVLIDSSKVVLGQNSNALSRRSQQVSADEHNQQEGA